MDLNFQITEENIIDIMEKNNIPYNNFFLNKINDNIDYEGIERSALKGTDIDAQKKYAYETVLEEIKRIGKNIPIIEVAQEANRLLEIGISKPNTKPNNDSNSPKTEIALSEIEAQRCLIEEADKSLYNIPPKQLKNAESEKYISIYDNSEISRFFQESFGNKNLLISPNYGNGGYRNMEFRIYAQEDAPYSIRIPVKLRKKAVELFNEKSFYRPTKIQVFKGVEPNTTNVYGIESATKQFSKTIKELEDEIMEFDKNVKDKRNEEFEEAQSAYQNKLQELGIPESAFKELAKLYEILEKKDMGRTV